MYTLTKKPSAGMFYQKIVFTTALKATDRRTDTSFFFFCLRSPKNKWLIVWFNIPDLPWAQTASATITNMKANFDISLTDPINKQSMFIYLLELRNCQMVQSQCPSGGRISAYMARSLIHRQFGHSCNSRSWQQNVCTFVVF